MRRRSRPRSWTARAVDLIAVLSTAVAVVALTPVASQAVARAANGSRCTIVGTAHRDVLHGSAHRDVICGGGGNDVINGRGGNDVIDGGPGNDSLSGSAGNDAVYGGAGRDTVDGGVGADRLDGGVDGDTLRGADGNDLVLGGAGDDTIYAGSGGDRIGGGDGRDVVRGEDGNDALTGDRGNDDLRGGPGTDRVSGGDGNDLETGDEGNDVVAGNLGDDDLSGGAGVDAVDGGAGFNVCDVPAAAGDTQTKCAVDTAKPVIGEVVASQRTVDISSGERIVRVRAHVTDDTGIKRVQIGSGADFVSGTHRDGIWESYVRVPRFSTPGPRSIDVTVTDRVGREVSETRQDVYTVVSSVVDKEMPVLRSLSLSTLSVDVRTAAKSITATVRLTDDLAGARRLYLCPAHAAATGLPSFRQAGACEEMGQTSGTRTDATWKGALTIPKGAVSGTWNVEVWVEDAATTSNSTDFWFGPEELAAHDVFVDPRDKAIPDGAGAFQVLGSTPDEHAPTLTSLTLSPSRVDTSSGAVQVTAEIVGTDVEGVTDVGLYIGGYAGYPDNSSAVDWVQIAWVQDFRLVSGTAQNGTWRATFVVPGGTPDGTYFVSASVQDTAHGESWVSDDSGWTSDSHLLTDGLAPTSTHFVVANSP